MAQIWSALECAVKWAGGVLECRAGTYMPPSAPDPFVLCERVGGQLDYPHDSPQIALQVWSHSEADAEDGATALAIAAKTMPPTDEHVNAVGTPDVYSYGVQEGDWFVWQTTVPFQCNLLDK